MFLFIDMEGSTAFAERLGPLALHRLLNRFVVDLTEPIAGARGEIHSYVGDELIATWKLDEGIAHAHCVAACFAAKDRLARLAPEYISEFGAAANFRAGLHCGPVVTGEMGSLKKEIVFLGDTVNTTARIQEMCRQTGERVLASADVVDGLELPPDVAKRSLGGLRLRGKENDVALYAVDANEGGRGAVRHPGEAGAIGARVLPSPPYEEGPGLWLFGAVLMALEAHGRGSAPRRSSPSH
ncbi:MAG: adenylate/guanylate cyclase domain-containing protein [Roseiarcus sp.]